MQGLFFRGSLNKNYKGAIAAAQTGNSHENVMMLGGGPDCLRGPQTRPRGIFPTSLYGQSAPACMFNEIDLYLETINGKF
jgi:hypothetical protein